MTFYQELQLSSVGSKQLIKNTTDPKEKRRHILIYNFKVYLVMAFCVAVVTLYSKLTGNDNSVVGVTVLLAVLVLRQADFYRRNIRNSYGWTKAGQYASTGGGLCCEYCLHHASYGAWLSQCDYVQSFNVCIGISAVVGV